MGRGVYVVGKLNISIPVAGVIIGTARMAFLTGIGSRPNRDMVTMITLESAARRISESGIFGPFVLGSYCTVTVVALKSSKDIVI
jgi:hypothetical protein